MKKYSVLLIIILVVVLVTGCRNKDQKLNEDVLRARIAEVLAKYQKGVNQADPQLLKEIISSKFSFYDVNRDQYIKDLLKATVVIENINYANLRIKDYKIIADVQTKGTLVYKPTVDIPLFKKQTPFMTGTFEEYSIFVFIYENDGLKILADDRGLILKHFSWGNALPLLEKVEINGSTVAPGDELEVSFQAGKGVNNDIGFVFINDKQIARYSNNDYQQTNAEKTEIRIPMDVHKGTNYDLAVLDFAGKLDVNRPNEALLQGIKIEILSVPVR